MRGLLGPGGPGDGLTAATRGSSTARETRTSHPERIGDGSSGAAIPTTADRLLDRSGAAARRDVGWPAGGRAGAGRWWCTATRTSSFRPRNRRIAGAHSSAELVLVPGAATCCRRTPGGALRAVLGFSRCPLTRQEQTTPRRRHRWRRVVERDAGERPPAGADAEGRPVGAVGDVVTGFFVAGKVRCHCISDRGVENLTLVFAASVATASSGSRRGPPIMGTPGPPESRMTTQRVLSRSTPPDASAPRFPPMPRRTQDGTEKRSSRHVGPS